MNNKIEDLNIKQNYDSRREQVDASVRFVLQNELAYYDALSDLPKRVEASLLHMICHWDSPSGYHFRVLREAHRQFSLRTGYMEDNEPPFTDDDLYA